jgi:SAM-dependent methyltransferase
MKRIDSILKWVERPSVLDVGCTSHTVKFGDAEWLHGRLRQNFDHVVGMDISEENILKLKSKGLDDLYVQDAENFSLPEKFNTIVAGELIEHLANPGSFLLCAKDQLHEKGLLIITAPYPFSLFYWLYAVMKYPKTCENEEHAAWFCPSTLTTLAKRLGYKIIHFEFVEDYDITDPLLEALP